MAELVLDIVHLRSTAEHLQALLTSHFKDKLQLHFEVKEIGMRGNTFQVVASSDNDIPGRLGGVLTNELFRWTGYYSCQINNVFG